MLQKKKVKVLAALLLTMTLFLGLSAVASAATYELDRIDLYDYYDSSDRVRISEDDIETYMEENVQWRRVLIVPRAVSGEVRVTGENVGINSDDEYYVALDEGETTRVTIGIYNSSGERQKRYYLDLTRGGVGIEKVVFTGDDFSKTIDSLAATNKLAVPTTESSLRLKVYLENSDYTVECNDSGSSNNAWNISVPKTGSVSVYLNLYDDDGREAGEYKFEISRSSSANSSNLDLIDKLKVKADDKEYELFPKFDDDTTEYYVCFPSTVKSAVIVPTLGDDAKSVKVNNKTVSSGNESGDLSVSTGGSSYTMRVTDDDGDTHDYTITLIRAQVSSGNAASLERLRIKRGSSKTESSMTEIDTEPVFDKYTYDYSLIAGGDSAYFCFRPQLADSDGITLISYGDTVALLEDDEYSSAIKLEADDEVAVRVYSPSFKYYKDYTFEVEGRKLSSDAYLESLALYVDGVKVSISPTFKEKTYTYTAEVSANASVFTVTPTAVDSNSTITVMGDTVKSGKASDEYSVGASFTNVPIVVTAEDGSTNTYRLTLNRSTTTTNNNNNNNITLNKDLKVVLRIGSKTYLVNGESKTLAAAPYITSDRTQVPLRVIAEALGAGVNYNPTAKQITINMGDERLYMDIGKTIKDFDVAPEVKANTTFVPIRYVTEKLGCKCTYNSASKEVVVTVE